MSEPMEMRVVSGLHCIDDFRARGWRLLSFSGGSDREPVAVMVRTPKEPEPIEERAP